MRSCLSITITEMVSKPEEKLLNQENTCPNLESKSPVVESNATDSYHSVGKFRKYYPWDQYQQVNYTFYKLNNLF